MATLSAFLSRLHALGMKVLLKPQIWVPGGFTGDLDFPTVEERREWFASYRDFIMHHAELAVKIKAEIFCIGTEMSKLTRHEAEWRKIVAEVRKTYKGSLTYAAVQGPEFETLKFWDALDYIGLNNYYPLPEDLSTRLNRGEGGSRAAEVQETGDFSGSRIRQSGSAPSGALG